MYFFGNFENVAISNDKNNFLMAILILNNIFTKVKQSEIIKTNLKTLESPLLMCPQGSQAYRKMCLHPLKLNLEIRCARAVLLKETAKKSYNQETGSGYRGHLKVLNGIIQNLHTFPFHKGS